MESEKTTSETTGNISTVGAASDGEGDGEKKKLKKRRELGQRERGRVARGAAVAAKGQQEGEAGWERLETVAHFPATVTDQTDEAVKEE